MGLSMHLSCFQVQLYCRTRRLRTRFDVSTSTHFFSTLLSVVLFDLYDFNEIQSLSCLDLQFAIISVISCTAKTLELNTYEVSEIEIATLVKETFNEHVRITLPQILKWTSINDKIRMFFSVLNMEGPLMTQVKQMTEQEYEMFQTFYDNVVDNEVQNAFVGSQFRPVDTETNSFVAKSASQLTSNRRIKNFRAWLASAIQPICQFRKNMVEYQKPFPDEFKVKLEWVHGIRSNDTRRAIQYAAGLISAQDTTVKEISVKDRERSEDEIAFYVASVVVLLNPQISRQRFYLGHSNEVISLAVSTVEGEFLATSELAAAPSIHVWSRKTLETLSVLKGEHARGVHLLSFTYDNKYLVSCGIQSPSAVIIYDWRLQQVIESFKIDQFTQAIVIMPEITYNKVENEQGIEVNNDVQGIAILSIKEIWLVTPKKSGTEHQGSATYFEKSKLIIEGAEISADGLEPMCGIMIRADQHNRYFGELAINENEQRHVFLTGHQDGGVYAWRVECYIGKLTQFETPVISMCYCSIGVAFATWEGVVQIWDGFLNSARFTLNLQDCQDPLFCFNISTIDFNRNQIMVLTIAGDVIIYSYEEIDNGNNEILQRFSEKRLNTVMQIPGSMRSMSILNQTEQQVIIGGDDGLLLTFDIATHTLTDLWAVGAKITAIATLSLEEGFMTAVGTVNGHLLIRQDYDLKNLRMLNCGNKAILDVCFSKDGMLITVASFDKCVYTLKFVDGEYVKSYQSKLDNGVPVSLNFSHDSKKIIICTNQRKLLLLDPVTQQLFYKSDDLANYLWSDWVGRYPLPQKSTTQLPVCMPICLGNNTNVTLSGDENGNIYLWKDFESIREDVGVNLSGHASPISRINLTPDDKRLFSIGVADKCLFQWKVGTVEQRPTPSSAVNIVKAKHEPETDIQDKIFVTDESLVNEVNYCFVQAPQETADQDMLPAQEQGVDNGLLIRGCNNSVMNRLGAKLNFQGEEQVWKRPPAVALVLDHIYGVQTSDRRNTVIYMHLHGDKPEDKLPPNASITAQLGIVGANNSRLDQILPKLLGPNFQQLLDPGQQIKYDPQHQTCHKHLVYFSSRFGIVYSPVKNTQTFYQGHSLKISCIQRHPTRRLIATGEVSNRPTIHVWDVQTLEPLIVLDTAHKGGILHLAFSPNGKILVSIGMDRAFSIQVFQWEQNRTLSFRNLGFYPVFGLRFYPFENQRFVTCGYEHMAIWRLNGNHLTCQRMQKYYSQKINIEHVNEPLHSILISVDFLNYRLGHEIVSDILFGTSQGEITTYCSGKHFVLNENAHKGSINCIKISDRLNDVVNVITGGEDGFIKIWDTSIQLLQSINVREVPQLLKDLKNERCYGVQSIEMYCCDKANPRRLLVGLRCGEILEAVITDQEGKAQKQAIQKEAGNTVIGMIGKQDAMLNFDFYTFISAHSSLAGSAGQKKINCVINPNLPILASVGDDETLRFWDLIKKQIIVSKYLGVQATSVAYSPEGTYLVIGLINGIMLVLDAKIQKLQYGTYMEEYSMPTLDVLQSPKEAKAAIVCLRFSYRGDYLAVSFNNEHSREDEKSTQYTSTLQGGDMNPKDPSFVIIYANRLSPKNPGIKLNSKDPYVKLMKIQVPLNVHQPSASIRGKLAVTLMDFSDCDNYLQLCLQSINHECVIDPAQYNYGEFNIFVIWEIQSNTMFTNFESLKSTVWPDWSMAPSINARLHGSVIHLEDVIEERQLLFRELVFMSQVARFSLQPNAIAGSHQGTLYIFRCEALSIDKMHVNDFQYDLVSKDQMADTRSFCGHTSMIQSIEIYEDRSVLSTSVSDQCIVQWRVEYEDRHWELDFNQIQLEQHPSALEPQQPIDPFGEYLTKEKFNKLLSEVWAQRKIVAEVNKNLSQVDYADPPCRFELEYCIGRRALDRRMNIKIDSRDRISYQASSLQVFLTENKNKNSELGIEEVQCNIHQEFLRPDGLRLKSISPELSTFCFSKDARILFCATAQIEAHVYIWETTTDMKLGEFSVKNVPIITNIKVSYDNKKLLILGITKEYIQVMMMVDWTLGNKILFQRQFYHSIVCRIREIEFVPNRTMSFITAGIQHLCFWRLSGDNLEYQVGELTIPKALVHFNHKTFSHNPQNSGKFGLSLVSKDAEKEQQLKTRGNGLQAQDDDLANLYVSFLNVSYIGNTLITSGDDGFIYLWEGYRIVRRIPAHQGAIFALHCNSKLGYMVSGGLDGKVVLWRFQKEIKSNLRTLERLRTCELNKEIVDAQKRVEMPECNVQSLCLGFNKIIVGVRTGSIFEMVISEDNKIIHPHQDGSDYKAWLKCADHECPRSVGIDQTSSRIYTVTAQGLFSVWSLENFDIIFQRSFGKKTRNLQVFNLSNKVMLVFEHELVVLDCDPKKSTYAEMPEYYLILNLITYATLASTESILGVATVSAAQPEVTIYAVDAGFVRIKQILGFKSSIRYLDFSTDNNFMQVADSAGENQLYELEQDKVNPKEIKFDTEFLGEGLRTFKKLQGVHNQFNNNNKIVHIKKLRGMPIVAIADELGTLRLFNYPNIQGETYYQSYSDHLFVLSDCMFSHNRLFFVSSCEMDKCVFKWRLLFNDEKIAQQNLAIENMTNEEHQHREVADSQLILE